MKNSKILKWVVIVGIIIVLNLFFNVSINLLYKAPQYNDICKQNQINVAPTSSASCVAIGGQWNEDGSFGKPVPVAVAPTEAMRGYCNTQFTCQKDYESANTVYSRNVFIVLVVLGLISIIAGFFTASFSVVSNGLSFGGILSLTIASIRYWSSMQDYLRVIILGLALAILIWIGIKKLKD